MTKFKIVIQTSVKEEDAHLMAFFPATLKGKLADTKVSIDSVSVIQEEETNSLC